ncbi:sigma-70 family RNA polymerase sigma factor [Streptomyces ficellus]|uniref:Sigma-70 family RNA polymerase sigma factor n=1 Tax=Streptomyces ficellus TaxID=1977088 RepID=A0ABT7ZAL5_9ACTN|nr:sigma-70 family RNA polymerase sigma factor [Streptomyces ficellus]MDN3296552.1 sigma-70 family RNA polymerase sigma factor [Streptomyces ficellus]
MATDMSHDRWQRAWSHREQLLKVARRRSMSVEDAEDAVHEAMLRAAEHPHLDDERLGAWLTTVTMRLCVDRYRQVHREAEVRRSPTLIAPGPAPVDEVVCDRAEATWLARRSGELPARQAEALWLKSEDLDVGQVAVKMGLSYRTVESLLARARRTLRNSLAGTLALVLWLCGRGRPRGVGNAQVVAAASTAATLAVAGFVLPHVQEWDRPAPAPATSGATPGAASGTADVRPAGRPHPVPSPSPTRATPGGPAAPVTRDAPAATGSAKPLLPLPLPLPTPPLPEVPEVPDLPDVPEVPPLPVPAPSAPLTVPDVPDVPEVADVPGLPPVPKPSLSVPVPGTALPAAPSAPSAAPSLPTP